MTSEIPMERPRTVAETMVVLSRLMHPQDANPVGNVHGGTIMKFIDDAAAVVATRHARRITVTASLDRLDFHEPVHVGDLLVLKASLNYVGRTSMEVGVRVEAEDLRTGEVRHTASAYLTYVAMDESGRPAPVPPLEPRTEDEKRRYEAGRTRREKRVKSRKG